MGRNHFDALLIQTERSESGSFPKHGCDGQHRFCKNSANLPFTRRPLIFMSRPKTVSAAWERLELTSFNENTAVMSTKAKSAAIKLPPLNISVATPLVADENANLREKARLDGYQAGFESGRAAAAAGEHKLAGQLAQAISKFESGVSQIEQVLADEVLALAIEIARKVVHQAIAVQPQIILDVIREALLQMPLQQAMIHLNQDDAALMRKHAGEQLTAAGHRIQEDPQLSRGDVLIEAGGAHLNARLATRWQNVLATLDNHTPWISNEEAENS